MAGPRQTIGLRITAAVLGATVAVAGCTSAPPPATRATANLPPQAAPAAGQAMASADTPNAQAMHQVIAEIQALGSLDPAAREELLENLKQTDPKLWPLLVERVRADLAWRRQAREREMAEAAGDGFRGAGSGSPCDAEGESRIFAARGSGQHPSSFSADPGPASGETERTTTPPRPFERDGSLLTHGTALPPPSHVAPAPQEVTLGDPRRPPLEGQIWEGDSPIFPAGKWGQSPSYFPAAPMVVAASYDASAKDAWQTPVEEAIRLLESDAARSPQSDGDFARHARLRMLYLVGNRRDEALRPIPSLAPATQEFWSKQLYGLATLMDPESISESGRRKAEAKEQLDEAVSKLGESCPLVVRNLAFATEIELFGRYKPFEKYEFRPGQKVLLYAELENFTSKETPRGFHTATRSSYQIFDSSGRRVAEHEFAPSEEYCPRARRDYFIGCEFSLPKLIFPGKHVLQLTVADQNSQKIGQSVIEFTINSSDD